MNSGFVAKDRDYLVGSEDAKWMSLDLISTVGFTPDDPEKSFIGVNKKASKDDKVEYARLLK